MLSFVFTWRQVGAKILGIDPHEGDSAMSKVMVLGANGRLGRAAVQAFAAAGWQVSA
jgi:hypothetical protein